MTQANGPSLEPGAALLAPRRPACVRNERNKG